MNPEPPNKLYVGPRPFGLHDQMSFFGREREVDEAVSHILAHRVLLIYAGSGAGKTSLMNAGIIPNLQREGCEVFPKARIGATTTGSEDAENIYVFNALTSVLPRDRESDADLKRMRLAEFSAAGTESVSADDMVALRILVFDQFEEFFTSYPERWQDRRGFFEQLSEALEADPYLRVVLVMREEFIARLDSYAPLLPDRLRIRFRIQRLRRDAALAAITGPARLQGRYFDPGVAEKLVDNLMTVRVRGVDGEIGISKGERVEPLQLQVICTTLWNALQPDEKVITMELLERLGSVEHALSDFYETSIHEVVADSGVDEAVLRRWFEHSLITPYGTRGTALRGATNTGGLPNQVVDLLERRYLVRSDWRGGARWYELGHDRLIEAIIDSNRKWLLRLSIEQQRLQTLEDLAARWHETGEMPSLQAAEIFEAKRLIAKAGIRVSNNVRALLATSESAIVQAHSRERLWIRALLITTILAILVAIVGWLR